MTDRTTISITTDLKTELDAAKTHDAESYESLLWRLLEHAAVDGLDEDALADEITARMDGYDVDVMLDESEFASMVVSDLVAQLPPRIAEELQ